MRVAIIGGGASGLAAAKNVSTQGIFCDVYEMAGELGGTWVYTDDVYLDQYGSDVHTAMYKGLTANLPREIMGFPDFPLPEQDYSFLDQKTILTFLNKYADHFQIRQLIKFYEKVVKVEPYDKSKWKVQSIHTSSKKESTQIYDVVMICNGHYNSPFIPKVVGQENFQGKIIHSRHYRSVELFKNERVLVVGAGFSGLDIALQVAGVATHVTISQTNRKREIKGKYPENVAMKPMIKSILDSQTIEFIDGTSSSFDSIIFCTGYQYVFPFLDESCGITIKNNHIQPLYKHMIHIENPTLCFIGVPFYVCAFQLFDLQARFYCQFLNGTMKLPTMEEMHLDNKKDILWRRNKGYSDKFMHYLGIHQSEYYDDLAKIASLTPIPSVICKIWSESDRSFFNDLINFRNCKYRVINNDSFVKIDKN